MLRFTYGQGGGVVFLTAWRGRRTLRPFIATPGAVPIGVIDYRRLIPAPFFRARAIVICDIERLSPAAEIRLIHAVRNWTEQSDAPLILNQPPNAMRRFALLRTLYNQGVNRRNLFRLDDPETVDCVQFPCFIRGENDHNIGKAPPKLLHDRDDLNLEINALLETGQPLFGKIVIEFEDTRDDDGLYRKLSYFKVGDKLIPAHRFWGRNWFLKFSDSSLLKEFPRLTEQEREFISAAPYQEDIRRVFDAAGVAYGRIDFGLRPDGGVHVFEINTNPNHPYIEQAAPERREIVADVQNRLRQAFTKLAEDRKAAVLKWPREDYWRRIQDKIKGLLSP